MSQPELAERVGVTFQQVQKYENGKNRISAGRLYEVAKALGVTIQYFYETAPRLLQTRRGVAEEQAAFEALKTARMRERRLDATEEEIKSEMTR